MKNLQLKSLLPLLFDVVPIFATSIYAITVLFAHDPTIKQIATLMALSAILIGWHLMLTLGIRADFNTINQLKEMSQLVQAQDLILRELQASNKLNTETSSFVVSQAELLQRMTSKLVLNKKAESNVPLEKIPAVGLTAEEVAKIKKVVRPKKPEWDSKRWNWNTKEEELHQRAKYEAELAKWEAEYGQSSNG